MSLEIAPDGADPLAKLAALTAVEACGHLADPRNAPPAVIGYAKGFARAVVAIAKTVKTLRTSDPAVVHNALSRIAREGLTPGDVGDKTSTAYLSPGKGGQISSEPNPRGRLAMARAAGIEVRTVAIHKADKIALNGDGDVDTDNTTLDPDNRPTKWEHVKGVMIHLDDVHTGARRSAWVSAAEIAERKAKTDGQGAWNTDPISMACSKAIKIAIARGAIPQASLIPAILAASAAHPTPARALTIKAAAAPRQIAEPAPVAPPAAEPEPTPEPTGAPSGLTIYTALADVKGWLGAQAPDGEIVERALSKQFALLQIASRTNGETVDRDSLTHDQHRKIVAGALAELQARPQPEAPAEPEQPVTSATGAGDVFDAIVVDLTAEAECTQETAATTVVRALEALKKTGRPFAIEDLRSQTMWVRLVQRAGEAERAARDEA
jgi:hypothetical protein